MDRETLIQSLRIIYHGFGAQAFFTDSAHIATGLSTAAADSKGVVNVLRFAIDAGVGKLYLPLIMNNQIPGPEFADNAINFLSYNGLSGESARFAVETFNDMLRWRNSQPVYVPSEIEEVHTDSDSRSLMSQRVRKGKHPSEKAQHNRPRESTDNNHKKTSFGSILITLLIFLISIAAGFGGSYLFFHFKDIFKGKTETSTAYTEVISQTYTVNAKGTPVFSKEDVNSASVAVLNKGDKVTVTSRGDKFSSVRLPNGVTGFVQNEKINLAE